jgi:hypothetical protein
MRVLNLTAPRDSGFPRSGYDSRAMSRPTILLAAVLAALVLSPAGVASTQLRLPGAEGSPFTALLPWSNVHGTSQKSRPGKTVKVGHSTLSIEAARLDEFQGVDLLDFAHQTAAAHAKFIARSHKGWRVASAAPGRFEVLSGKNVLQYLVFAAEAASPETFHVRLVKDGGDGQKLLRALDKPGTRFWLGAEDPRTITSDQNGLALVQQVNQAFGTTQQLTATAALDSAPQGRAEFVRADSYVAGFDPDGTLTGWRKGPTEYGLDTKNQCWQVDSNAGSDSLWSESFVPTNLYALRVQPPKPQGATVELDYSAFDANTAQPDTVIVITDATTHLPVSATFQSNSVGTIVETFDWLTTIVEQPQPTGPLCP